MTTLRLDARNRKRLALAVLLAPLAAVFLYWFVLVGFSDPATRLRDDLRRQARRTLLGRVPQTFTHRPITQWTLPMEDFYISLRRDGEIRISDGGEEEGRYRSRVAEPAAVAGNFEFRDVGSAVEIELIPAGDLAQVASVRPIE